MNLFKMRNTPRNYIQASDMTSMASSVSTRGAQTLEWLCNEIQREGGQRKYVCDPGCMEDLREVSTEYQ